MRLIREAVRYASLMTVLFTVGFAGIGIASDQVAEYLFGNARGLLGTVQRLGIFSVIVWCAFFALASLILNDKGMKRNG